MNDMKEYLNEHYSNIKDDLTDEQVKIIRNSYGYNAYMLNKHCNQFIKDLKGYILILRSKLK